jgi:hypothetical protein
MKSNNRKRLPYGSSNFEKIRTEGYVYVDKTRYIELLEQETNDKLFLLRPRKFGKSLFFSMLTHYYNMCSADRFETLFGDLYIGKCPTPKHNELMVLKFNFSGLDTSGADAFRKSFLSGIRSDIRWFILTHRTVIDYMYFRNLADKEGDSVEGYVNLAFQAAGSIHFTSKT